MAEVWRELVTWSQSSVWSEYEIYLWPRAPGVMLWHSPHSAIYQAHNELVIDPAANQPVLARPCLFCKPGKGLPLSLLLSHGPAPGLTPHPQTQADDYQK